MTHHVLKDQMKCKSDRSTSCLLKKVKFKVKNEAKHFYQTKDHYFLFLDGETQNILKSKD